MGHKHKWEKYLDTHYKPRHKKWEHAFNKLIDKLSKIYKKKYGK